MTTEQHQVAALTSTGRQFVEFIGEGPQEHVADKATRALLGLLVPEGLLM